MQPEDQDALRRFNEEWDSAHTSDTPNQPVNSNSGKVIQESGGVGLEDQLAQMKASLAGGTGVYQPANIPTTGDNCPQCGVMHPPVRPGEVCKVAVEMGKVDKDGQPITPSQPDTPKRVEANSVVNYEYPNVQKNSFPEAFEDEKTDQKVVEETQTPVKVAPQPVTSVQPEPAPLAENNIPTEVHVNKYLNSWGQLIETHCKTHNIVNVKRLMRHLTVEITDFLEHNKGR